MLCTLTKPDESTVQESCTGSIQFSVSSIPGMSEYLNLTVNQRSSDVVVGLPHDVVVWSVILHLVRREVKLRSGRVLKAGNLYFDINAGAAHVYKLNSDQANMLRQRKPIEETMPFMIVDSEQGMFELANTYTRQSGAINVQGYSETSHHSGIKMKQAL
ncbi:hypothetical protein ACA910_009144 [Epithemia clementina (nom. ined.)]